MERERERLRKEESDEVVGWGGRQERMGGNDEEMAEQANWLGGLVAHLSKPQKKKEGRQYLRRRKRIK